METHHVIGKKTTRKTLKVVELFAGVGGFRLGLEGWKGMSASSQYKKRLNSIFQFVWSNQWEPATKIQHASAIYEKRFGKENHSNKDIGTVSHLEIPDHDILVGGFPCQDYSVAKQLSKSHGLKGKKGMLWWQIHRILKHKRPNYVCLENVDRLIKSPFQQRGRDFAVMLASLSDLGYTVEWRIINAADYGMPQRRRRIFIFGYHKKSRIYKKIVDSVSWIKTNGLFAQAFPVVPIDEMASHKIEGSIARITANFNKQHNSPHVFGNTGIMMDRSVSTFESKPIYNGKCVVLKDIIIDYKDVPKEYLLDENLDKWRYLKGAKKELRKKSNGQMFYYTEGAMSFPDSLDKPSRTIITTEGGKAPSRFKHVIKQANKLRRLTPIELERINMFPDNHTEDENDNKRAFLMGNALVVGVIEKICLGIKDLLD